MSVLINHPAAPAKSTAGSRAFSSAFVARTLDQARFMDSRKTGTAERCLTSPFCTPLSLRELVLDRLVQASKVSSMTRSHETLRVSQADDRRQWAQRQAQRTRPHPGISVI